MAALPAFKHLQSISVNVIDGVKVRTAHFSGIAPVKKTQHFIPKSKSGNKIYGFNNRVVRESVVNKKWTFTAEIDGAKTREYVERAEREGMEVSRQRLSPTQGQFMFMQAIAKSNAAYDRWEATEETRDDLIAATRAY